MKLYKNHWLILAWRRSDPEFRILRYMHQYQLYWLSSLAISQGVGLEEDLVKVVLRDWNQINVVDASWNQQEWKYRITVIGCKHFENYSRQHGL